MNLLSLSLKSFFLVFLSVNGFAQAPSTLGKSKAGEQAKTAEKKDKKPATQTSDFMPTAEDLSDETAKKDPNEEIKDLQDKRWVEQGAIEKPRPVNTPSGRVTWTSTCTDKKGKELKPEDAGYETCMQALSDAKNNKAGSDSIDVEASKPELTPGGKPKVGVQFKIGD